MAENSGIEWTDHTFNPWEGCQKVGPGCDHCYAETRNARFVPKNDPARGTAPNWGPGAPRRRTSAANWNKPLQWNRDAEAFAAANGGRKQRVFCASLADVFDNAVDPKWRRDLFDLIARTPALDWLLLTKRIGNVRAMVQDCGFTALPANVWLGATIVNQAEADRDIPKLLAAPAAVRFLSMEPLLGPVDLSTLQEGLPVNAWLTWLDGLDWVIVGGESGDEARPMHPDWARNLRDQCKAANVPFLFKQWGEWGRAEVAPSGTVGHYAIAQRVFESDYPTRVFKVDAYPRQFDLFGGSSVMQRVGKKAAGRLLDGVTHTEFPS
jgi:protein gp37